MAHKGLKNPSAEREPAEGFSNLSWENVRSGYSRSIVKNPLQFVAVCSSESYLHPVSKNDENPWGQIWVTAT